MSLNLNHSIFFIVAFHGTAKKSKNGISTIEGELDTAITTLQTLTNTKSHTLALTQSFIKKRVIVVCGYSGFWESCKNTLISSHYRFNNPRVIAE